MTALTQLSQAIMMPRVGINLNNFKIQKESRIIPLAEEALGAVVFGFRCP